MSFKQIYIRKIEEVQRAEYVTVPEQSLLKQIVINALYQLVKEKDSSMIIHVYKHSGRNNTQRKE